MLIHIETDYHTKLLLRFLLAQNQFAVYWLGGKWSLCIGEFQYAIEYHFDSGKSTQFISIDGLLKIAYCCFSKEHLIAPISLVSILNRMLLIPLISHTKLYAMPNDIWSVHAIENDAKMHRWLVTFALHTFCPSTTHVWHFDRNWSEFHVISILICNSSSWMIN